jgi:hypothetical protein
VAGVSVTSLDAVLRTLEWEFEESCDIEAPGRYIIVGFRLVGSLFSEEERGRESPVSKVSLVEVWPRES